MSKKEPNDLDEVWAYDEPHYSGGNCHITMTKQQAIDFMKFCYPYTYIDKDEEAFIEWINVNWAYKENEKKTKES